MNNYCILNLLPLEWTLAKSEFQQSSLEKKAPTKSKSELIIPNFLKKKSKRSKPTFRVPYKTLQIFQGKP